MKRSFFNPNYVYVAGFSIPFIIYSFQWSTLYPDLSFSLLFFYTCSFVVCLALGYISNKLLPVRYHDIPASRFNTVITASVYIIYALEVAYSRQLPLIGILQGNYAYGLDIFGIPVIHTFIVSFNMFYCVYLFHQYLSTKNKKFLLQYFLLLLPFVLLVYRSSILGVLLSSFVIYLLSKQHIAFKTIARSAVIILLVLYGFGYLGNVRSAGGDALAIPRSSGATDEFMESNVPKEYYWTYLYVASPVANLQNNINYTKQPGADWKTLFLSECVPVFFIKFFIPQINAREFYQINEYLNVGTIYVYSFSYKRWQGIIFMFCYFIFFLNVYYAFIIRSKTFSATGIALLCNVIIFATFHNTISYSTSSMQLFFPVVFSMLKAYGLKL